MADDEDILARPLLSGKVGLVLDGMAVEFDVAMPDGLLNVDDLTPLFQSLSSVVVQAAEQRVEAAGKTVSCRAGCGACCRQAVPITEAEARQIAALVEAMPEPRRSQVVERFEAIYRTLEDCDLGRRLLEALRTRGGLDRELIIGYFHLGIPCPFLEEESCSIHAQRPMICREYLVTSDPVHCAALDGEHIERVKLTGIEKRVMRVGTRDTPHGLIQMFEALRFAAGHPAPPRDRPGPDILLEVIKSDTPKPQPAAQASRS
jgi:Fe-S-cluster containining protein